ncbi:hypothetical protein K0U73_06455 [bacterium]|nr:hypothetical protein [bacterium]
MTTPRSLGKNVKGATRGDAFNSDYPAGVVGEGRADAKTPAVMSGERRPERG